MLVYQHTHVGIQYQHILVDVLCGGYILHVLDQLAY